MVEATIDLYELFLRAELLRDLGPISVSAPSRDDKGRYWLFVNVAASGEAYSIPHMVIPDRYDRDELMLVYQHAIADELARRGFDVGQATDGAFEIGRLV